MIKKYITKAIALMIVTMSVMAFNPIVAKAEWISTADGWIYKYGDSYVTGWQKMSGQRDNGLSYHFDGTGHMDLAISVDTTSTLDNIVNLETVNNKDYYMKQKGSEWYYYDYETALKKTGWSYFNKKWFYIENGKPQTGWKLINGNWYFFTYLGANMLHDTIIDGYKLGSDGAWIK